MISLHDQPGDEAHDQFQSWRAEHWDSPTQLFANAPEGGGYVLHKASCSHFEGCDVPRSTFNMTANEKVCWTRVEIEREVGRRHLKECPECFGR